MENELASIHITYWRNQLESRLLARCEQVSREAISTKGLIPLATHRFDLPLEVRYCVLFAVAPPFDARCSHDHES